MDQNRSKRLLRIGITGTIITAICCFTPLLVVLLGLAGLGVMTGYLDYILLPGMIIFMGIALYAWNKKGEGCACGK